MCDVFMVSASASGIQDEKLKPKRRLGNKKQLSEAPN